MKNLPHILWKTCILAVCSALVIWLWPANSKTVRVGPITQSTLTTRLSNTCDRLLTRALASLRGGGAKPASGAVGLTYWMNVNTSLPPAWVSGLPDSWSKAYGRTHQLEVRPRLPSSWSFPVHIQTNQPPVIRLPSGLDSLPKELNDLLKILTMLPLRGETFTSRLQNRDRFLSVLG